MKLFQGLSINDVTLLGEGVRDFVTAVHEVILQACVIFLKCLADVCYLQEKGVEKINFLSQKKNSLQKNASHANCEVRTNSFDTFQKFCFEDSKSKLSLVKPVSLARVFVFVQFPVMMDQLR